MLNLPQRVGEGQGAKLRTGAGRGAKHRAGVGQKANLPELGMVNH
jgi:hypothetical protein